MPQRIDFAALAARLLQRGYTTRALASQIGLSQPAVSRLATRRTKTLGADAAVALIRLAGGTVEVPPDQFEAQQEAA
jgi:transcriptional regulator with XRE-family HTH domain